MPVFHDQIGRIIEISAHPKRIISLVPSQTELLSDLGLEKEVVGITKFCIHPEKWFREKQRVGGTKNIRFEKIISLRPDLVIANKEENVKEQIEELAKIFPVWVSDVNTLQDAYQMMESLGAITGRVEAARTLLENIRNNFLQIQIPGTKLKTAYLIWKDPYMTVGGDTFIHHLLETAGFENLFAKQCRYPQIEIEALQNSDCDLLFLSSEPYPFKEKHVNELQEQLPRTRVMLVDGELFSWYGSRLLQAPAYFQQLQRQVTLVP